jgi:O-antigen/teichoic acid export membrane protein
MLYLLSLVLLFAAASIPSWALDPARLIPGGSQALFLAAVVIGGGRAASRVLSETNRGFGHVNLAGLGADLIGPSIGLAGVAALTWLTTEDVTAVRVVWLLAFGWCAATLFAAWWAPIRPALRPARVPARGDRLRNAVGVLGVVSILNVGIQQAHIIIAGLMLPTAVAAGFATAARLAPLAGTPLVLLSAVASPDVGVALQSRDPARIRQLEARLQRVTGLLLLLSLPLVAIFLLAGSQVLTLLFGAPYAVGHQELVILSLGPLASLAVGVAGMCLIQAGRRRRVLLDTIVGSFAALGLMVAGGMRAGSTGLAVGYALGQLTINLLLLRSCRLELGVMPYARPLAGLRWLNSVHRVRRRPSTPS